MFGQIRALTCIYHRYLDHILCHPFASCDLPQWQPCCRRRVLLWRQCLDRIWSEYVCPSFVASTFRTSRADTYLVESRVDVKDLKTYQQVYIYIIPIITNLGFVNIAVVLARIWWFRQQLKTAGKLLLYQTHPYSAADTVFSEPVPLRCDNEDVEGKPHDEKNDEALALRNTVLSATHPVRSPIIKFDGDVRDVPKDRSEVALRVPGPRDRENGNCSHV